MVALKSGLEHTPGTTAASFHLRSDDTDLDRTEQGAEDLIKHELRWLGIDWQDEFSQTDPESKQRYSTVEGALRAVGLVVQNPSSFVNSLNLNTERESTYGGYYNLTFDLKRGPLIKHTPPQMYRDVPEMQRGDPKVVELSRADGRPFYRFSGCVDDIARTTIAFRDNRQCGLSEIQSHIRYGIEQVRQILRTSSPKVVSRARLAKDLWTALNMKGNATSIPLVVYGHLQVVVDNRGDRLSKRNIRASYESDHPEDAPNGDSASFTIESLRDSGISPEAVLAYLLTTILVPCQSPPSREGHLRSLIRVFAEVGHNAALRMLAPDVDLRHLVRSTKDIRCNLRRLACANRWLIQALPPWRAWRLFADDEAETAPGSTAHPHPDHSPHTRSRIYQARREFADFRQIREVLDGPAEGPPPAISPGTTAFLQEAGDGLIGGGVRDPVAFVRRARALLAALRAGPDRSRAA